MQEYLDKKQLAQQLSISPKTLQKELMGAMKDGCSAVLKIGKSYRIEPNGFISYLVNKNKSKSEEMECERRNLKISVNEAIHTTLTTTTRRDSGSALQLKQMLKI